MLLSYIFINTIFGICSNFFYKKFWNPISVYIAVWMSSVLLHESGLIRFYSLTQKTWLVLIGSESLYMLGCLLGRIIAKKIRYQKVKQDGELLEHFLKKLIIFISLIVTVATFVNVWNTIQVYGVNLFVNISRVYQDSITGRNTVEKISYVSSLNFVSLVLSGIYISKFKFRKFLIWPMVLVFGDQITNGSRGSLMSGIFLFLASVILFGASSKVNKKMVYGIALGGGIGFLLITYFRGIGHKSTLPYASKLLRQISGGSGILYRIIIYITSPLGVLNEYLKAPVYGNWGESTFRVFRNVMAKLGMDVEFREVIDIGIYNTPIQSNVGTYVGELIKDFKIPGALFVCFLLGMLFSYSYIRYEKYASILHGILVTTYFYVVCLSFFAWYVRLVIFWYVVILGGALGFLLDKIRLRKIKWEWNK